MKKNTSNCLTEAEALKQTIAVLKNKQTEEFNELKEQVHVVFESFKPVNLIKHTLQDASASPDIKSSLVNNAIGLTTGYLTRKVLIGSSINPIKNIVGAALQFAIANVVSKHPDGIKSTGSKILKRLFKNRKVEVAQN